uniref:Uncharacterized protein n=1 Tax=Anguilla anguilla TaxID=7936 RepID=A0A0E9XV23_ANGAN
MSIAVQSVLYCMLSVILFPI